MKRKNCVHCGEEMECSYGNDNFVAPFCNDPKCPNYGLLQSGILPSPEDKK